MSRSIRTRQHNADRLSRRQLLGAALGAGPLACLGVAGTVRAQTATGPITTTALDGVSLIAGAGCNVIALPGSEGSLLIDGGLAANAEALLLAAKEATGNERVATLLNTHWHPPHTGANVAVGSAGGTIFAHENTRLYLSNTVYSSVSFDGRLEPLPEVGRPTEITRGDGRIDFDGTRIDYGYLPAAHTDGDLYLHFPELDVLVAGGVVSGERWPLLDYRNGAWYGGRVRALEWLAELVDPDTLVVPGHGPVISGRDVMRQNEIYQELFVTLIDYMNRGFGAEDAVEHNPLADYEAEFGDPSAFLDGAYRSMLIAYVPE